jgi:molybdenum cofactor cytidylyltransferase
MARVLTHPSGGLKNIPQHARRILFLNQANSQNRIAAAQEIAGQVEDSYESILIGDLRSIQPEPSGGADGEGTAVESVHEKIAGVVLAAGGSSRFGGVPKQTLAWKGSPFVRHVAGVALESGLDPVIVVTGAGQENVLEAVRNMPISIQHNPEWEGGQSTSVKAGMGMVPQVCGGVIFFLADQPQVDKTLVAAVVGRHRQTLAAVVAPRASGKRGNPVLFDRVTFGALTRLTGDAGGRTLFSTNPIEWVDWHDEGILIDVDTEEDLKAFLEKYPDSVS